MKKPGNTEVTFVLVDPNTGKPTGRTGTLGQADRDLANHSPWYEDEEGVYTICELFQTPVKLYMHSVVAARHLPLPNGRRFKKAILADGIVPEHVCEDPLFVGTR